MSDDIKQHLRTFLTTEIKPGLKIDDDESLLENGVLDSMAITRLIEFIEDKLGVEIPDDDFDPENFDTLTAMTKLVASKKG